MQSWRTGQRYSVTVRRHWELEDEDIPPAACAGFGSSPAVFCPEAGNNDEVEKGLLDDIFGSATRGLNSSVAHLSDQLNKLSK
jgi:hypothetical protein